MSEIKIISEILESRPITEAPPKHRYSEYDWVELTEDEKEDALAVRRMMKGSVMEEQQKKANAIARIKRVQTPWTYDELREEILERTKQLPFDFIIDKQNERVFHLLCLYYSGDERFNEEEIEYANGTKQKLSLKKGIGLISAKKGTGKTVLMQLFQQNKHRPYLQIETKYVSAMYNNDGEEAIKKHSTLLPVPPTPTFFYYTQIGICFDDLGFELPKNSWGNKSDVIADVLFSIYSKNQITGDYSPYHFTSNLSGNDFDNRYGDRIRDRMREMFNVIIVPGESRRK